MNQPVKFSSKIRNTQSFPPFTIMVMDIPSHSSEEEIESEIRRRAHPYNLGEISVFLSRKVGLKTNEGFGYVYLSSSTDYAVIKSSDLKIKNQEILTFDPVPQHEMRAVLLNKKKRQIHVSGLNRKLSRDNLVKYFSQFGDVENIALARHFKTDRLLGFATVEFKYEKGVDCVLMEKAHRIDGKKIKCKVKLLKSEIDFIRPFEESKYSPKFPELPNSDDPKKNSPKYSNNQKVYSKESFGPSLRRGGVPCSRPPPPPLGDVHRDFDPRAKMFKQEKLKKIEKHKLDFNSDLRAQNFAKTPNYEFFFSAPNQNLVTNNLSRPRNNHHFDRQHQPYVYSNQGKFMNVQYASQVPTGCHDQEMPMDMNFMVVE